MSTRGVVLDRPLANAFLIAAMEEGLLDDDPMIGDGFVRQLKSIPVRKDQLEHALGQLVIGGRIVLPFAVPSEWGGKLFDLGLILKSNGLLSDPLYKVSADGMSYEMMLAMLSARGVIWTVSDLDQLYKKFLNALQEWVVFTPMLIA